MKHTYISKNTFKKIQAANAKTVKWDFIELKCFCTTEKAILPLLLPWSDGTRG